MATSTPTMDYLLRGLFLSLVISLFNLPVALSKPRLPGPYIRYHTEPNFLPNDINIYRKPDNASVLSPGYIFIAPHVANRGWGPQIFDEQGNLIWYGFGTVNKFKGRKTYAMNLYVCDYRGELQNHLCYSEARPEGHDVGIRTAGANRVFDNHYRQVGPDYGIAGNFTFPNPHEFNMLPGGESFLQAVYYLKEMDLTAYTGNRRGYVFSGCFQEVNVRTEEEIFRWCFLKHHPIWNTHIFLHNDKNTVNVSSPVGGTGVKEDPWDFMHLNAVDKNSEGDYIVSGRHLNSILKIAGPKTRSGRKPGETIWRLGGEFSDFKLMSDEPGANFSMQHHCRFGSISHNEETITLFNNANNGITAPTANYSSAISLIVNNETMEARLEQIYKQPQNRLAYAQGSMQNLPNGNVFVGWGARPQWSEFSENGTLLYHAGAHANAQGKLSNYRTYKFPWVGKPLGLPKLVAYCRACEGSSDESSPLVAYVSWNGATEVKNWRFSVSYTSRRGPWLPVGKFAKQGFETQAHLSSNTLSNRASFAPYVAVDALDKDDNVLARSTRKTFVPNRLVKDQCGKWGCKAPPPAPFYYVKMYNRADTCDLNNYRWLPQAAVLVLFLVLIECVDYLLASFLLPMGVSYARGRGRYEFIPNGKLGDA